MKLQRSQPEETLLVPRLLIGLVEGVCRFPRLVLVLSFLLALLSIASFAQFIEYQTQRSDLINPNKDCQQRWRKYVAEFGDDEDIVVVVKGVDRPRMEQALEALAGEVGRQTTLFDRLFYKVDLRPLQDRALLFLPTEQIAQIQSNIKSMSLLLDLGPLSWQSLGLSSLLHEARLRAGRIEFSRQLSPADEQFFTQLLSLSRTATATLIDPDNYRPPWDSLMPEAPGQDNHLAQPQYFFSGDGTLAFLLARPVKEKGSFTAGKQSVDALRSIVAALGPHYPELEFGLTGLPVLETDEMAAAERDTKLASWLAIAGVSLLFLLVYRSVYYPLLTVATLLVGTAWAMGWLTLTVGHLNILSATFAVMLIGMGDYGVLWVMRYEQARRGGADVRTALRHTARHVAVGNLTAATTLALAFFAAMFADFKAVAELGWIAGCGVLLCAFACFTVLPALLMICDRRMKIEDRNVTSDDSRSGVAPFDPQSSILNPLPSRAPSWLPAIFRRPRWVLAPGLAVIALLAICAGKLTYDHNLLHLQARDLDSVKWELTLIEHTAGASWHAISYADTPEKALALKERYEQLPEVSRVVEVASLVPRDQERKLELVADIHQRLQRLPQRGVPIPHVRPGAPDMQMQVNDLLNWLQCADPEAQPLLAQLGRALRTLEAQLRVAIDPNVLERRLQEFDGRMAGDLAENLHRLRDVSKPAPITLADLPPDLRVRYVGQTGKWLLSVFAKDCLWDFEPLAHFCSQVHTVDAEATGKPFSTVEGLQAMKQGFEKAGLYAFFVIAAVLLADFRNGRNTLIALTPLVSGIILSLGIMGLFGLPLNPANMIAFPLILGVGVDNGVHVLHDWLLRRGKGRSTISSAIGRGVLVKALTTMIGFGSLMISSERGLAGLGFILALGVGCCMVTALVVLPAVLAMLGAKRDHLPAAELIAAPRYAEAA
jgi:hopanoid biosynthesis associated RND transporter like protein HpnN